MEFQEMFERCVHVVKHGMYFGENCRIKDNTYDDEAGVDVFDPGTRLLVQAKDAFEAVRYYLDIENEVFTIGDLQDPIVLLSDKEIMNEQDRNRKASYKYTYPYLEARYVS